LAVYAGEYGRTSFQGGLNWYRIQTQPDIAGEMEVWSGAKISVPTVFVAGKRDWGTFQEPGAVEAMEQAKSVKSGMYKGTVLVDGAGHWVNQEQPERCVQEVLRLIEDTPDPD
jgi:pimeloyl-ACP methyl ester carboxylesterase